MAGLAGASVFAFGKPADAAPQPKPLITKLAHGARGNFSAATRQALNIAAGSQLIQRSYSDLYYLGRSITDYKLRKNVLGLLDSPVPAYAVRLRAAAERESLRQELLMAGFIDKAEGIDAFLPSSTDDFSKAFQPFFSSAGSAQDSHHAYPGGLVLHELFNARAAIALADNYDREYFGGVRTISRDVVLAAALYHDVMKTVVFQWGDDGKLSFEPNIAGTGAHHILSAAEAIARGHDARFVTVVLSAHAAPSLGDEVKVVAWARAAAMVAGVDPADYGLLKRKGDGFELASLPPIEAFISNLSDHDYVLSVHAMHEVAPRADALIASGKVSQAQRLWYRNALLSNISAIRLYQTLTNDERSFRTQVERELSRVSL